MTLAPIRETQSTDIQRAKRQTPAFMSPQVIAGDEATFIDAALKARKAVLEGIDTFNDHQLVQMFLSDCSATGSKETEKTYERQIQSLVVRNTQVQILNLSPIDRISQAQK